MKCHVVLGFLKNGGNSFLGVFWPYYPLSSWMVVLLGFLNHPVVFIRATLSRLSSFWWWRFRRGPRNKAERSEWITMREVLKLNFDTTVMHNKLVFAAICRNTTGEVVAVAIWLASWLLSLERWSSYSKASVICCGGFWMGPRYFGGRCTDPYLPY